MLAGRNRRVLLSKDHLLEKKNQCWVAASGIASRLHLTEPVLRCCGGLVQGRNAWIGFTLCSAKDAASGSHLLLSNKCLQSARHQHRELIYSHNSGSPVSLQYEVLSGPEIQSKRIFSLPLELRIWMSLGMSLDAYLYFQTPCSLKKSIFQHWFACEENLE